MSDDRITEAKLYLTFQLEDEIFSIDVSQVREVLDLSTITKVPQAPDFMCGVINVRGSVVPVVDMRLKFGMSAIERTHDTRIVVMELDMDGEITIFGAMADSVKEVIELEPDQIEPPPKLGSRWRTEFIRGIGKRDEYFILILDVDRIFSGDELVMVQAAGNDRSVNREKAGQETNLEATAASSL